MSAPAPPRHVFPVVPSSNGFRDAPSGSSGGDNGSRQPAGRGRPFPHIRDIVYKAETSVDPRASIGKLLEAAALSVKQARSYLDFGRLDLAFTEYLTTTFILSNILPTHKDAPEIAGNPRLSAMKKDILQKYLSLQKTFDQVQETIKEDNLRSGVHPVLVEQRPRNGNLVSTRYDPTHNAKDTNGVHRLPSPPRQSTEYSSPTRGTSKPKPTPLPKPHNLHGISVALTGSHHASSAVDALSQRFAKLRTGHGSGHHGHASSAVDLADQSDSHVSKSGHVSTTSLGSVKSSYAPSNSALYGASDKSALNSNDYFGSTASTIATKDLPKPPSPTYSPSRQVPPGSTGQPYYDSRSSRLSVESSSSVGYHPVGSSDNGYSTKSSSRRPQIPNRGTSVNLPRETEITAEKLYDYLRSFSILLIDVRNRDDYDAGHIFAPSVMCIEPTALRPDMSAEQLEEALVLSPAEEESLFSRRNEFDLVVYYDRSTTTRDFLTGRRGSPALKYLYDALYEFNEEKPLRWGPILLIGGLDAWIDVLGNQSLQVSSTVSSHPQARPTRPLARRPAPSNSSQLYIQKRRLRDYNPLDQEEESRWREKARHDSYALDALPRPEVNEHEAMPAEPERSVKNSEDFYERYPDVATVEQQYLSSRPPTTAPPQPPRIPDYPTPPPRSYVAPPLSDIPSRPQPARARPSYRGESERIPSLTLARTPSSQLAPYIPAKMRRLPRTGLHNFGVTCYMNSTIQCLSATIDLTNFFIDGSFMKYIQRDNWKGSKGLMPELYCILLRNLWESKDADTIRPSNFRKFCARLNKEWGIDRQQDAKEFLDFLLDCLHEDLNVNWSRNPLRALTDSEESERERTPPLIASKREWDRYMHRDDSKLTQLFAGQHISRLQCTTCHNSSTTYEPFWSISVEIPPAPNGRLVDIRDCLRSYCSSEVLSGDEVWRCPHCRKEREATKRITITRAPEFLVIHFKRFSAGTQAGSSARKIHTPIEFPLTGLDMTPFVLSPPDAAARNHISKTYGDAELQTPFSMTPPYKYDAYAVLRHLGGTMTSGHYIALVRDKARNCWREFNDNRVTDFRPEDLSPSKRLQNEQAYIVFYQRSRA